MSNNEKQLIVCMPKWSMYFSWIGILFEIIFSFIIIPLFSKDYTNLFPVIINNRSYTISRIWDIINLIIIIVLIYILASYKRQKIVVDSNMIKVYPVIGKEYNLRFEDIKSVKRESYGFVEEIIIKTNNNKKFTTENVHCGYSEFCKLLIENTKPSIRVGFDDII